MKAQTVMTLDHCDPTDVHVWPSRTPNGSFLSLRCGAMELFLEGSGDKSVAHARRFAAQLLTAADELERQLAAMPPLPTSEDVLGILNAPTEEK
jgi:hypothetical protein